MRHVSVVVGLLILNFAVGTIYCQSVPVDLCPKRMTGLKYPRLAHFAGVQGKVELEAIVSRDGGVEEVHTISGPPLLAEWMKEALKEWLFTNCSQISVPCRYKVTFVFELMTGSCEMSQCPNEVQIDLPVITIRSQQARAIIN